MVKWINFISSLKPTLSITRENPTFYYLRVTQTIPFRSIYAISAEKLGQGCAEYSFTLYC